MRISDWSSDVCSSDLERASTAALAVTAIRSRSMSSTSLMLHQAALTGMFTICSVESSLISSSSRAKRTAITHTGEDRKSVVQGKSVSVRVDLGGRRSMKKKTKINKMKKKQKKK